MNMEECKNHVGKQVMSHDAGNKLIHSIRIAHGPWLLTQITKGGVAVITNGKEKRKVPPSLLKKLKNECK